MANKKKEVRILDYWRLRKVGKKDGYIEGFLQSTETCGGPGELSGMYQSMVQEFSNFDGWEEGMVVTIGDTRVYLGRPQNEPKLKTRGGSSTTNDSFAWNSSFEWMVTNNRTTSSLTATRPMTAREERELVADMERELDEAAVGLDEESLL